MPDRPCAFAPSYVPLVRHPSRSPRHALHPRRRPRPPCLSMGPRQPSRQQPPSPQPFDQSQSVPASAPEDSYLQCPQCRAMYEVDHDEMDASPRVVSCSACLHQWYASEDDLLWGDHVALKAIISASKTPPYVISYKRASMPSENSNSDSRSPTSPRPERQSDQPQWRNRKQWKNSPPPVSKSQQATSASVETSDSSAEDFQEAPLLEDDGTFENGGTDEPSDEYLNQPLDDDSSETSSPEPSPSTSSNVGVNQESFSLADVAQKKTSSKGYTNSDSAYNIFVGNLSFRATEEDLYRAFSGFGFVVNCQVPCDAGGASKGFGFVKMRDRQSGLHAMETLQGASLLGRDISLSEARERPSGPVNPRKTSRSNSGYSDFRRRKGGNRRHSDKRFTRN